MNDNHLHILRTLNDAGHDAYVVGGSVRDFVLGRPCKDVDITTSATPSQLCDLFDDVDLVGAHFGVCLVPINGETFEVATFRTDGVYKDSRHPESVTLTTDVREDLKRRDFTINTLLQDASGKVIDHMGGLVDLFSYRCIRAVGNPDERFQEDALRMLRAVRFAVQLDFAIEPETYKAISNNAHLLCKISAERIAGELNKMLTSGRAADSITLMADLGLLKNIIPEVIDLADCPQSPKWHPEGNVYLHTLGLLEQLPAGCSLTLALGALLHDIGKPATLTIKEDGTPTAYGHEDVGEYIAEDILKRLKYPNDVIEAAKSHVLNHMTFADLKYMRRAKQIRFIRQDNFAELLELHRLDRLAGSGDLSHYEYAKQLLAETPPEVQRPTPLINGRDLIALGLKPGPAFKKMLHVVETLQLEGALTTKEHALELLTTNQVWVEYFYHVDKETDGRYA